MERALPFYTFDISLILLYFCTYDISVLMYMFADYRLICDSYSFYLLPLLLSFYLTAFILVYLSLLFYPPCGDVIPGQRLAGRLSLLVVLLTVLNLAYRFVCVVAYKRVMSDFRRNPTLSEIVYF